MNTSSIRFLLLLVSTVFVSEALEIKVNTRGINGYKRLSKKYRNEWSELPVSTIVALKRNRVFLTEGSASTPQTRNSTTETPASLIKYMSNDLSAVDWNPGPPPPHEKVAKMARYIVATSDWLSLSTISTATGIAGYPFTNILSTSDGPPGESSGNPYMYITPLDFSSKDLQEDSRASVSMSLAQGNFCKDKEYDPEDPRCARVIISGNVVKIPTNSSEENFAKVSMFTRHPVMENWPKDHGFYFVKMNITNIIMLDFFGGAKVITPDDYFKVILDD